MSHVVVTRRMAGLGNRIRKLVVPRWVVLARGDLGGDGLPYQRVRGAEVR